MTKNCYEPNFYAKKIGRIKLAKNFLEKKEKKKKKIAIKAF